MSNKLPTNCPSCNDALFVSDLCCQTCKTSINGTFEIPFFSKLNDEEQKFVHQFIIESGSLKNMASKMGLSYPTVRNYLDSLIEKISNNHPTN
jgi:hypothetical protein